MTLRWALVWLAFATLAVVWTLYVMIEVG